MLTHPEVTQEHIETGIPGTCFDCPVALAIRPFVADGFMVEVSNQFRIRSFGPKFVFQSDLPSRVRDFIRRFDSWNSVEPFAFDLDIPDEFLKKPMEADHA